MAEEDAIERQFRQQSELERRATLSSWDSFFEFVRKAAEALRLVVDILDIATRLFRIFAGG